MYCELCQKEIDISIKDFAYRHVWLVHKTNKQVYYDNYLKNPSEGCCKVCNAQTSFTTIEHGYKPYCSSACVANSEECKTKSKISIKERYGDVHPNMSTEARDKLRKTMRSDEYKTKHKAGVNAAIDTRNDGIVSKRKETNLTRYGVELPSQNKEILNKSKNTNIEKYGVEWTSQVDGFKAKKEDTNIERYGYKSPLLQESVKQQIVSNKRESQWGGLLLKSKSNDFNILFTLDEYKKMGFIEPKFHCNKCNKDWVSDSCSSYEISCPTCYISRSKYEDEIYQYLIDIGIDSSLIQQNKTIVHNGKRISYDIYMESLGLAIDFHGLYWHSDIHQEPSSHINRKYFSKSMHVDLIQILETHWVNKSDVVKSIIRHRLSKNILTIGARKCEIRVVNRSDYRVFIDYNHIQGFIPSSNVYGLYYQDNLVAVASFGKSRFKANEVELYRYAQSSTISVMGGLSRLCKHFMKLNSMSKLITYCDLLLFNGNGYIKSGFTYVEDTKPNYYYFKHNSLLLHSRIKFQKHKLSKLLSIYDNDITEVANMKANGWMRIFDAGNRKFELII